jgi:hypothetical protein
MRSMGRNDDRGFVGMGGSVVWETTAKLPNQPARLNSDDFWLELQSPLTTLSTEFRL